MQNELADLIRRAAEARDQAVAPYSKFRVGAALETADHEIITGCNIESASYGLTVCAERVAVFKALSEGKRRFVRLAVVADSETPSPPCGACRQVLWEFCPEIEIVLADNAGGSERIDIAALYPRPFDASLL